MLLSAIYHKLKNLLVNEDRNDDIPSEDGSYHGVELARDLDRNIKLVQSIFKDCDDIIYRPFKIAGAIKAELIFMDGLINIDFIDDYIIKPLMLEARMADIKIEDEEDAFRYAQDNIISTGSMRNTKHLEDVLFNIMTGTAVIFIDGVDRALIAEVKGWEHRSIQDPATEPAIRGPRDAFTETLRINTTLIRRRIRDPQLKLKTYHIGRRSKTDVVLMYIEDIVNPALLEDVKRRLDGIDVDSVFGVGFIEQIIEDNWISPFPQLRRTERPDIAAVALLEGRVCILVDNTPFVLLAPTSMNDLMHSVDDYYQRWPIATFVRIVRFIGTFAALILPSLYIAMISYHPEMVPTQLALSIAAARDGIPFPAFLEAFIMEGSLELLREAGMRLPVMMGQTIGVVGAIIIGQAAVAANIVTQAMVVVVAATAIANFAVPSYDLALSLRILRFTLMFLATILGLYGVIFGILLILSHISVLKSFGVPYMAPWVPMNFRELKDTIFRAPWLSMRQRPYILGVRDKKRMDIDEMDDVIQQRRGIEH